MKADIISMCQKALYFSAIGLLRASYAGEVPFLRRIGWMRETIRMLEEERPPARK